MGIASVVFAKEKQKAPIRDVWVKAYLAAPIDLKLKFLNAAAYLAIQIDEQRFNASENQSISKKNRQVQFLSLLFKAAYADAGAKKLEPCLYAGNRSFMIEANGKKVCSHPMTFYKKQTESASAPSTAAKVYKHNLNLVEQYLKSDETQLKNLKECRDSKNHRLILCNPLIFGPNTICVPAGEVESANSSLRCLYKARANPEKTMSAIQSHVEVSSSFKIDLAEFIEDTLDLCLCRTGERISKDYSDRISTHRTCYALISALKDLLKNLLERDHAFCANTGWYFPGDSKKAYFKISQLEPLLEKNLETRLGPSSPEASTVQNSFLALAEALELENGHQLGDNLAAVLELEDSYHQLAVESEENNGPLCENLRDGLIESMDSGDTDAGSDLETDKGEEDEEVASVFDGLTLNIKVNDSSATNPVVKFEAQLLDENGEDKLAEFLEEHGDKAQLVWTRKKSFKTIQKGSEEIKNKQIIEVLKENVQELAARNSAAQSNPQGDLASSLESSTNADTEDSIDSYYTVEIIHESEDPLKKKVRIPLFTPSYFQPSWMGGKI